MSKRYGRNQKRKHRAEVAEAHKALDWCRELVATTHKELSMLQNAHMDLLKDMRHVASVLGENSIAFPPKTVAASPVRDHLEFQVKTRHGYSVLNLPYLLSRVDLDKANGMVHFFVRIAENKVAYAIRLSDIKIANRKWIVENISEQLLNHLVHELSRKEQS